MYNRKKDWKTFEMFLLKCLFAASHTSVSMKLDGSTAQHFDSLPVPHGGKKIPFISVHPFQKTKLNAAT